MLKLGMRAGGDGGGGGRHGHGGLGVSCRSSL